MAERPSDETLRAIADGVLAERSTHEALARELLEAREVIAATRPLIALMASLREQGRLPERGVVVGDGYTGPIAEALQRYDESRHG